MNETFGLLPTVIEKLGFEFEDVRTGTKKGRMIPISRAGRNTTYQ